MKLKACEPHQEPAGGVPSFTFLTRILEVGVAFGMNATISLVQLCPRSFRRWRALSVFGPHLDDFVHWLGDQGYAAGSIRNYLSVLPQVVRWLRRKKIDSLAQLTHQDLQAAYQYYRPRSLGLSGTVRALGRFYLERGTVPQGEPHPHLWRSSSNDLPSTCARAVD